MYWLKRQVEWITYTRVNSTKPIDAGRENLSSLIITNEEAKSRLRKVVGDRVENGWHIEMQNEFDVIISKKKSFPWIVNLLMVLIWLVIFTPLALVWLFAMLIVAITRKPITRRIWIEKSGEIYER